MSHSIVLPQVWGSADGGDFRHFLNPEQAANYLGGLNSRTVTRWAREGYLPAYPIGEGKLLLATCFGPLRRFNLAHPWNVEV